MTIFEKIINKEIPSYKIYEDDLVYAFLDISQTTKGHTLVVPKKAYKDIYEIDDDTLAHLIKVVRFISLKIKETLNPLGINLLNNNGSVAGQTVFHFHFHIIPRYDNNDVSFVFKNNSNTYTNDTYEKIRASITKAL